MGRRRRADAGAIALAALLAHGGAAAQVTPVFTAPLVQPAVAPPPEPVREPLTPREMVRWFESACVATQGQAGAAIDWALSNGFEPVDPMRGSTDGLLDGKPGTVLTAPGADGRVMLAAAEADCSLWIEGEEGPPVRQALAAAVGALVGKGAKARVEVDRNVERAGAWRGQVQWRYRAMGGSLDFGVAAVTTLANGPGTQVLRVSPLARAVEFAPDGVRLR